MDDFEAYADFRYREGLANIDRYKKGWPQKDASHCPDCKQPLQFDSVYGITYYCPNCEDYFCEDELDDLA